MNRPAAAPSPGGGQPAAEPGPRGSRPRRIRVGEVPPLADGFTDRPETAAGLREALSPGAALALVPASPAPERARTGPGTSGSTQIAAYLAETLWQSGDIDLLIWVTATTRPSILSVLSEAFTAATGLTPAATAESDAIRLTAWLASTGRSWLVVLDDLSDAADLGGLWPAGPAGRVLMTTSRAVVTASGQRQVRVFPVGFFSAREALSFLMERTTADPDQRRGAVDLIDALGGEPLALAQAIAVIGSSAMTCEDYRAGFLTRRAQIRDAQGTVPPATAVTWLLSFELAEQNQPRNVAGLLLVMLALLDWHGIPGSVFATPAVSAHLAGTPGDPGVVAPERAWDALLALEQAGLIRITRDRRAQGPAVVGISREIQAAIRRAAPDDMRDYAARMAAAALFEAWPDEEPPAPDGRYLRASAAVLQREAAGVLWTADACHPLLLRAGRSLDEDRLTGPAVGHWRELTGASEKKLGPAHPGTIAIIAQLAAAHLAAGQAREAVTCYQRVLAGYRQLAGQGYGPPQGHPGLIGARAGLGRALLGTGELKDAVAVLAEAAAEHETALGAAHPDTLAVVDELAAAYQATGQSAEAIALFKRVLADRERHQGAQAPATMAAREHLITAFLAAGRAKDGLGQSKRLLADRERALGPDHPETIAARGNLAVACHVAGKMTAALQHAERARADSARVLGVDHRDTLTRSLELAQIYYTASRLGDSADLLRETAAHCERVLPPGDQLTLAVEENMTGLPESEPAGRPRRRP